MLFISQLACAQQDPQFSQLMFNQACINPGYAGSDSSGLYEAFALNRSQFAGFEGGSGTTMFNLSGPLDIGGTKGGVLFSLDNDRVGYFTKTAINLGYAYRIDLSKGTLGVGASFGMFFSTLDAGSWRLPQGNGTDPAVPTSKGTKQNIDLGVGCFYAYDRLSLGFSCTHLTEPAFVASDLGSRLKRNYYISGGYRWSFSNPDFELRPFFLVHTDFVSSLFTISAIVAYKAKYWGGINYRINNAVGLILGLELFTSLRAGYCYEYNTSALGKFSGGNHEFMLSYRFAVILDKGRQKFKSVRYL